MRFSLVFFLILIILVLFFLGLLASRDQSFSFDFKEMKIRESSRSQELLFFGDLMLGRKIADQIDDYGPDFHFQLIKERLKEADLVFANLEGPVSHSGENQGSIYSFLFDPKLLPTLKSSGIDVVSLANNHIWDWGKEALEETFLHLDDTGIAFAGAGKNFEEANKPSLIGLEDLDIAFYSFTNLYPEDLEAGANTAGISSFNLERLKKEIKDLRKRGTDLVIVAMHWGEEYETSPNSQQRRMGRALIDAGSDLVVGHHPHVTQELEKYKDGWIAYSLGNFIFDQNFSEETRKGLMLDLDIRDGKIFDLEKVRIAFSYAYQPYLVD